jgi:hypothetical protein
MEKQGKGNRERGGEKKKRGKGRDTRMIHQGGWKRKKGEPRWWNTRRNRRKEKKEKKGKRRRVE